KEELRRSGSIVMKAADVARVPAGGALAVDRDVFAATMTEWVTSHPRIAIRHEIVRRIPDATATEPVILATGPLTGDDLAADLAKVAGHHLAYYDAIAPIVSADSIDWTKVFKQSRWGKGADEPTAPEVRPEAGRRPEGPKTDAPRDTKRDATATGDE